MLKRKPKTTTQKMRAQADEVMDRLAPHVGSAREKAEPVMKEARLRAAEAREKANPHVETVRNKFATEVLPVVTAAVAAASEATEEARAEARKRGGATAAALKGDVEPPRRKRSRRFSKLLVLLGLGAVAAFLAKKMSDRDASSAWQSSYTPAPASSSGSGGASTPTYGAPGVAATGAADLDDTPMGTAAAAAAAQAHDEAGAGPDEAAADAEEHPHPASTPDAPADEVRVEDDHDNNKG
jgi:hypothetical protein